MKSKEVVTFLNFELNITADELIGKLDTLDNEKMKEINILIDIMDSFSNGYFDVRFSTFDWNDIPTTIANCKIFRSPAFWATMGYDENDIKAADNDPLFAEEVDMVAAVNGIKASFDADPNAAMVQAKKLRKKNGEIANIISNFKIVEFFENGDPKRLIGTYIDVTNQQQL